MTSGTDLKEQLREHWEQETCGTRYGSAASRRDYFEEVFSSRYERTPYIREFAGFATAAGKRVLEIGVGAGSDFRSWVKNGAVATGIDYTEAAVSLTREHLRLQGIHDDAYALMQADAERLPFEEASFDLVYSYGVLHHTPDTHAAFAEACRVLRPGGELRAMIYHVPSWTGAMLWVRYALLKLKPRLSQKDVMFRHLESPGTKAYTLDEARRLLESAGLRVASLEPKLCPGDYLNIKPSNRYQGRAYALVWKLYPRWLVRLLGDRYGLNLLIRAEKPA